MVRVAFQFGVFAVFFVIFYVAHRSASLTCVHLSSSYPLARYPGPFLAGATDLYAAYHAWKGDIHLDMWRCHQKYGMNLKNRLGICVGPFPNVKQGKFVRYGPNRLNTKNIAGIKDNH